MQEELRFSHTEYSYDNLNRQIETRNYDMSYGTGSTSGSMTPPAPSTTAYPSNTPYYSHSLATYDVAGNVLTYTDSAAPGQAGRETENQYDGLNRLTDQKQIDPATQNVLAETTSTYDADSNLLSSTQIMSAAPNRTTSYTYDALGRQLSVTDPLGNVTSYTYDVLGNMLSTGDSLENTTFYTYDHLSRQIIRHRPTERSNGHQLQLRPKW